VLVIAGTGSIACARDEQGRLIRAGGWGAAFDDAGSGFDVGRRAVRSALRALDGRGPETRLGAAIARGLKLKDFRKIIGRRLSPPEIASLAPVAIEAARRGDPVAQRIIEEAGRELAELAWALIRRSGPGAHSMPVVCAGGLFQASGALRRSFARHLRLHVPQALISMLSREPVEGALRLARNAAVERAHPG
ncbi:MAG TPA: BadF/BadG/BcrA/BcrD ATPase family protein, partial [Terriglobia bacterium]|nr:BadF/BadG/BcrA/BcrD ATPase family protein [Terriglobia bacterium]